MKHVQTRRLIERFAILIMLLGISAVARAGWEVQWIDTFSGNGVNWDNWTAQIPANYNNEIQCYTNDEVSANRNYEVSNGTLKITARRQDINCPGLNGAPRTWTSGRLNSKDKAEFLYGRIESRIRFNELRGGTWPAFWMLENRIAEYPVKGDNDTINWPNPGAGEIDVWEWYANSADRYITNFFNVYGCGGEYRKAYPGGAADVLDFHVYAIEWDADKITFFMDESPVVSYDVSNCPQYKEPMFVLLNVAVGGNLGGAVDSTLNQATMEVDYVAFCVPTDTNQATQCNQSTPPMVDDDGDGIANSRDLCPDTLPNTEVNHSGCEINAVPKVPAPTPVIPGSSVISLFSDSYNNIPGVDFNPNWGQSTKVDQVDIAGNNTLKYSYLNYQGTDYGDNPQDVTAMDYLHIDYWTSDASALKIYLISPGPVERAFTFNVVKQSWRSHIIPLSAFEGVNLAQTFQLKVEGNGTVFLDNIFFSAEIADADGDGVADEDDLCPDTPPGTHVDSNGCETAPPNMAPSVRLLARQNGTTVTVVASDRGPVTVSATVSDENNNDSHSFAWQTDDLDSFTAEGPVLTFDPAGLEKGSISISLTVTDDGEPAMSGAATILLKVTAPVVEGSSGGGGAVSMYGLILLVLWACRKHRYH